MSPPTTILWLAGSVQMKAAKSQIDDISARTVAQRELPH
jgi:hypothetical protein